MRNVLGAAGPNCGKLTQQVVELGMFAHIGGNERAFGDDLEPQRPDLLQSAAYEPRPDAMAGQLLRHLRMHEGDDTGLHAVKSKRCVPVGVKLKAALGRVVANIVGHGRLPSSVVTCALAESTDGNKRIGELPVIPSPAITDSSWPGLSRPHTACE